METRDRIIEQMLVHVERFGRKRTRLVSLAEDLGMSHANIYRHFKNKHEILDALVQDWLKAADKVIDEAAARETNPEQICTAMVLALHRYLKDKLDNEPAAIEVFRHAFSDQPEAVAEHLTRLRLKIGHQVTEYADGIGEPASTIALRLDLLTTVLEPFLNPVLMFERKSDNDQQQLQMLVAQFFPRRWS